MTYRTYLVQYKPSMERQECFNVGLLATDGQETLRRFLTDEEWLARFGPDGRLSIEGSFDNWRAWRMWLERLPIKDVNPRKNSTYQVFQASVRVLGSGNTTLEEYADSQFENMVL